MKSLFVLLLALVCVTGFSVAQTSTPTKPSSDTQKSATSSKPAPAATMAEMQNTLNQLTQSNHDLLELLKKQQGVLDDIQYDRRLQSRQIQSLEERLEEALQEKAALQSKVAHLEAVAALPPQNPPSTPTSVPPNSPISTNSTIPPITEQPPPPPSTYLPPPESEGAPGTMSWHRLLTLKGTDGQTSDLFHIQGRQWRVLWHNLDKPGKSYQNTSALFISAFPKDDTIPQKVCAKLGSGGDSTELIGPGNYYLKIEASGGSWELAVEDFR